MVNRLQDKVAIITGAAGGIGLETTILFVREGASVLMLDISEAALERALAKVNELCPDLKSSNNFVKTKKCDVSKEADVQAAVESMDEHGGIDVMFNNAGIMHAEDDDAINTAEKIWDLTQAINVKGVWFGCKHAVLSMRRHKKARGSIINTASMVALVGAAAPQLAYTASKGAVLALTRELAMDWLGDDLQKRYRREVHFPMGRFGEAIEQANAVVFLASDESSFILGQDFVVDGGMTKAYVTGEGPPTASPKNNAT
ncbi:hypothetical protein LTR64_005910 [Lithohypha guttulata]|uniref:uncharacterized protein n=1 Tax=Lithohypha guttulata TaxID=1690604 RepID=UPI002DE166C1|nr:hypothetical protein LTR51_002293 [Lithohypha guttulata]